MALTKAMIVSNPSKTNRGSEYNQLVRDLLSYYGPPSKRPVANTSQTVDVYFRTLIVQVIEFEWKDEFLKWDPADYGDIDHIVVDSSLIWKPDLNLVENVSPGFIQQNDQPVYIYSDGTAVWYVPTITTTSCRVNVRYFPFDSQSCTLTFSSWLYDSRGLNLLFLNDTGDSEFFENGVWSISVTAKAQDRYYPCCIHPYRLIVYTVHLHRHYQHYLFNMVIPAGLLSFLNVAVFLVPPESGEKISFAVANLLSAILFQQLVSEFMPPLGSSIPLLGIYFMFSVMASYFSLTVAMVVLRVYHTEESYPMPRILRMSTGIASPPKNDSDRTTIKQDVITNVADKSRSCNGTETDLVVENGRRSIEPNEWQRLAHRIDRCLCVVVSFCTVAVDVYVVAMYLVRV
ncbi:neuronal acetylcholine receptor subunit alpha-10-like [Diadema antillarum]|uniref:neuronal acetylcholine receptor subunit alpha-10-like n=1 Tax=Diadema antillarum TaxID=105358 RepID=UPI003A84ACBF